MTIDAGTCTGSARFQPRRSNGKRRPSQKIAGIHNA